MFGLNLPRLVVIAADLDRILIGFDLYVIEIYNRNVQVVGMCLVSG